MEMYNRRIERVEGGPHFGQRVSPVQPLYYQPELPRVQQLAQNVLVLTQRLLPLNISIQHREMADNASQVSLALQELPVHEAELASIQIVQRLEEMVDEFELFVENYQNEAIIQSRIQRELVLQRVREDSQRLQRVSRRRYTAILKIMCVIIGITLIITSMCYGLFGGDANDNLEDQGT